MAIGDKLPPRGTTYKYKALEFWAQGGVICIEDTSDETEGRFRTVSIQEFLHRAVALKNCVQHVKYDYADERRQDEKFVEEAALCVRQAMRQGDPFDPKVLEHFYKHRRRSFICGVDGKPVFLHTASQSECGSQNKNLPAVPVAPPNKPFTPLIY